MSVFNHKFKMKPKQLNLTQTKQIRSRPWEDWHVAQFLRMMLRSIIFMKCCQNEDIVMMQSYKVIIII